MKSISQPSQNGVLFASCGILLLILMQPMSPFFTALGVVAMVTVMILGIVTEWRQSFDEVQKHASRSAAIGAMPIAFIGALMTALAVTFWPEAAEVLLRITASAEEHGTSRAFVLGVLATIVWVLAAHVVLFLAWWSRK